MIEFFLPLLFWSFFSSHAILVKKNSFLYLLRELLVKHFSCLILLRFYICYCKFMCRFNIDIKSRKIHMYERKLIFSIIDLF